MGSATALCSASLPPTPSACSPTTTDDGDAPMIRKAFRMAVNPSEYDEYERRHSPIWQELQEVLRAHGARDYSIFLDETDGSLFGYVEIEDEARWDAIASTEVCRRWWTYMRDIMPTNPDDSPRSRPLREVFHLD